MKNKNIIALLLAVALLTTLSIPVFADFTLCEDDPTQASWGKYYTNNTSVSDILKNFGGITAPQSKSILSDYKPMYVVTKYGNLAYLYNNSTGSKKVGDVSEGSYVLVLAVKNGYSLICVSKYYGGWIANKFLEDGYYSGPNPSDTENLPQEYRRPVKSQYLDEYETMYCKTKRGVRAQLWKIPLNEDGAKTDDSNVGGYVYEAEEVTMIARSGNYVFVVTEGGKRGWINISLLVEDY